MPQLTASAWQAADLRVLIGVQSALPGSPSLRASTALSLAGEHALCWLTLIAAGAAVDGGQRRQWVRAGVVVLLAHGTAVVLKRGVRRPRPTSPGVVVHRRTASGLSFPSAHTTSTAAAVVALRPLVGPAVLAALPAMALARLRLGLHYPSDVVGGAVLGAVVALAAARVW